MIEDLNKSLYINSTFKAWNVGWKHDFNFSFQIDFYRKHFLRSFYSLQIHPQTNINANINSILIIFQTFQVSVNILLTLFFILSYSTQIPVSEILGETICWAMNSLRECRGLKIILGGFFMAVYRMINMNTPQYVKHKSSEYWKGMKNTITPIRDVVSKTGQITA